MESETQGELVLSTGPYTDTPETDPKFAFTRLTTSTVHPLSQRMLAGGLDHLLTLESQLTCEFSFSRFAPIDERVIAPLTDRLDFSGAYGLYFWEIFFHIPFLVANTLNANQRFAEAQQWYHYIFNPQAKPANGTGLISDQSLNGASEEPPPQHLADRLWQFQPFRHHHLEKLQSMLTNPQEIAVYDSDPFDAEAIAKLRMGAFEKAIVMHYIDNGLDWGDALFAQDNWESIVRAVMLYVLGKDLLGQKPQLSQASPALPAKTFQDISDAFDTGHIPEFLVELEHRVEPSNQGLMLQHTPFHAGDTYFCIGENEELVQYWDRVDDRLYKIRHCMNIEGVVRQLALFQPPVDLREIVANTASSRALSQIAATPTIPHYRFSHMVQQAKSVTSTLIQLGSALLSAQEKKDAEDIALLRSTHEKTILALTTRLKEKQIVEAQENLASLQKSLSGAQYRRNHYQQLQRQGLSAAERTSLDLTTAALYLQAASAGIRAGAVVAHLIPTIFGLADGGLQPGSSVSEVASVTDSFAGIFNQMSSLSATIGNYQRRTEEWDLQKTLADYDVQQIAHQIEAAQLRHAIAERDLQVHHKSVQQADEMEDFLKTKFTSRDLYQWMLGRISSVYFQTYKIAFDLAQAAQRAYQYERDNDETFVSFGYWDSLKKGLLAGEGLMLSLDQLEKAYLDQNARALEIEKTISLLQLNPLAVHALKTTGQCTFDFTERLFDYDFSGHYCRKIAAVSISIPAVVGPYQNIQASLIQHNNRVVLKPDLQAVQFLLGEDNAPEPDASILRSNWRANQQIALSKGVNDSGMFELNFRDERYLPFEGTGAISRWELRLPKATNPIDFNSISDVIIHLRYTAEDGGAVFRNAVTALKPLKQFFGVRFVSLRQEFPTEWHKLLNPENGQPHTENFDISAHMFRRHLQNLTIGNKQGEVSKVTMLGIVPNGQNGLPTLTLNDKEVSADGSVESPREPGAWGVGVTNGSPDTLSDILLILPYNGKLEWSA